MSDQNRNTGDCNTGDCNTGDCNTGDRNTGDCNTGDCNTGDWNTGDCNTGYRNTGDCNTGDWNTGNCNTGDRNTGHRNTGDCNTGDCNTGDWNTGDCNTGYRNTGHWNTGHRNTGHWNACNKESGFFNSEQSKTIRVFNKDCDIELWESASKPSFLYFNLTVWVSSSDMNEDEKTSHPESEVSGGYLKKLEYKEAFKKSYENASEEEKQMLLELPNFDADVFLEISGIDVRKNPNQKEIESIRKEMEVLSGRLRELEK